MRQFCYICGMAKKKTQKIAIYPGSFDPIHPGHMEVIFQAAKVFDKVIVLVADNPDKDYKVSAEDRVSLIKEFIRLYRDECSNVTVDRTYDTLYGYCQDKSKYDPDNAVGFIVRGIRNGADLEFEQSQKYFVSVMGDACLSLTYAYFTTRPVMSVLSSSALRQVIQLATNEEFCMAYWPDIPVESEMSSRIYNMYKGKC